MENKLNPLHNFYLNQEIYHAVRTYFIDNLKELAINKTFAGEVVTGIKEAKQIIEESFDEIEKKYDPKRKTEQTTSE